MPSIRPSAWRCGANAPWSSRPSVRNYPTGALEARIDLTHCPRLARTLRDWGLYEEDGSRQFVFRSTTRNWDDFSPRGTDVLEGTQAAHLAPLPWERHVELVAALRRAGAAIISIDLDDRRLAAVDRAAVTRLMASVDLFLPSRQDGRVIFPDTTPADTVRRFRDLSPDTPLIVLKCGAEGCVAHPKGSRDLIVLPAVPVRAQDATGAGDTFCGGTLVGYVHTRDPIEALLHGAVSASFCVEALGVTGLLDSRPEVARQRLQALRASIDMQPF